MIVTHYRQLPRGEVRMREAIYLAARCLDSPDVAVRINPRSRSDNDLTEAEYWEVCELLYARPRGSPVSRNEDGIPACGCSVPLYHYASLVHQSNLGGLQPTDGEWYSEADLGFVEEPPGCVGLWLEMARRVEPPAKRRGRSGRPGTDWHLRGRLRGLVSRIECAREAVRDAGVVSPATCAALLLFFTGEALEQEPAIWALDAAALPPQLPKIEMVRPGVASAKSLRRLAKRIDDLARPLRQNGD